MTALAERGTIMGAERHHPDRLWFLNTHVIVRIGHAASADGLCLLESRAPHGDSPPRHVHHAEDELFHVLEGDLRFHVGDGEFHVGAGESLLAPKGVPHTYRVESAGGARWLVVVKGGNFERFVRAVSRPAERDGLPDPAAATPEQIEALTSIGRRHGIEMVGPPLSPL